MAGSTGQNPSRYTDRFGVLLVLTVATIVLLALVELPRSVDDFSAVMSFLVINSLVGATFLLSLRAGGVSRRWLRVSTGLVVGGLVATTAIYVLMLTLDEVGTVGLRTPSLLFDVLALMAPIAVCRRLVQHPRVSVNTMLGAISAYLLIALGFALAFLTVDDRLTEPFFGSPEPSTSFMYFSLTTITTVGLGDLSPESPLARLLTGAEAIIGQVYLVTFVAMIVALYVKNRSVDP
ncbi:MAG: ion channel [Microthrixaceae bacterium]